MGRDNHVTGGMSRDEACASGASFLASLGAFGEDLLMYGCAYLEQNKITYRISPDASQIYQFQETSTHQNLYPTAVSSYVHRSAVPGGMREQLAYQVKLTLARQIQAQYPRYFFELLDPLAQTPANNSSFPLLTTMVDAIDGYFNAGQLQLLDGTIEFAYNAKLLDNQHYQQLQQWLTETRRQMESDPIVQNKISRTLYGFCYQDNDGTIKSTINARIEKIYERHTIIKQSKKLVGPLLQQTYWMKDFNEISTAREKFKLWLEQLQNESYFSLLATIKKLSTAINQNAFQQALSQIESTGKPQAIADFKWYGRLWNVLP